MRYITSDSHLKMLRLSVRSCNALRRFGIDTVGKLLEVPIEELLKVRALGQKSVNEIREAIVGIRTGENGILFVNDDGSIIKQQEFKSKDVDLFYDYDGLLRKNIPLEDLNLSVRAYNCLNNNGIRYASELMKLSKEDLQAFKNMGLKTGQEVSEIMNSICFEVADDQDTIQSNGMSITYEITRAFVVEVKKYLDIHAKLLHTALYKPIETYVKEHHIEDKTVQDYINDDQNFIEHLYSQDILRKALKDHIAQTLQKEPYGLSYIAIEMQLPDYLRYIDIVVKLLDEMQANGDIHMTEDGIHWLYPTVFDYVQTITDERVRAFLFGRLCGETLEELGQKYGITRERVRQVVYKQIKKRPRLREDRYTKVFEKYCFEKHDFMDAFDENELTYNYLNITYSRGFMPIEALTEDTDFPLSFRKAAEKIVFKNYIIVDGERVKLTKSEIAYYVLKTYFVDEASFEDFVSVYKIFLQEQNLGSNNLLLFDDRSYQNKLADANYILWKQNKRLRYYDIEEYDFDELLQTLAFDQYSDIECSTLKFFRDYPELMRTYDIRDEYELHNLLKKLYKGVEKKNINFRRMPTIEFGTADRDAQVLEMLLQYAPVSLNDLADAYELEYGIRSDTVKANYLKNFDEYFYNGMYTIDVDPLPSEDSQCLNAVLIDDFYSIADIKRIYSRELPESDPNKLNPFNIKMLGFRVFSSYAVRNTYLNASEYFRKLLTKHDTMDLRDLPKIMLQKTLFATELAELKKQYEIIEFSPSKVINFRKLVAAGFTKDNFKNYCDAVYSATDRGSYFTIYSLQKNGFSHLLDKLGFEEWFYSSILSQDRDRFSCQRTGKTRVFVKGQKVVMLKDFIENLVSEWQSIDIYDLVALMEDDYGVTIDKYKVIKMVANSAMYYDSIMEKVYINYETYFEGV